VTTAGGTYIVPPGEWTLRYKIPAGYAKPNPYDAETGSITEPVTVTAGNAADIHVSVAPVIYPSVSPVSPARQSVGVGGDIAELTATAYLPGGSGNVTYQWLRSAGGAQPIAVTTTAQAVSGTPISYSPDPEPEPGVYAYSVRAESASGGISISAPATVTVGYALKFDLQGATGGAIPPLTGAGAKPLPDQATLDSLGVIAPVTKPTFKGWTTENYTHSNAAGVPHGVYYEPGAPFAFNGTEDVTLHAVWSAETPDTSALNSEFVIVPGDFSGFGEKYHYHDYGSLKELVEDGGLVGHYVLLTDACDDSTDGLLWGKVPRVTNDNGGMKGPIGGTRTNTPASEEAAKFKGVFNGNGRTVNLAMTAAAKTPSASGGDDYYAGLFAYVFGTNIYNSNLTVNAAGTVKNLRVTGSVSVTGLTEVRNVWAGGIAGKLLKGNIYNVVSEVSVAAEGAQASTLGDQVDGMVRAGGVVGGGERTGNNSNITYMAYCIASGDVSATRTGGERITIGNNNNYPTFQFASVGGIAGHDATSTNTKFYAYNCVALNANLSVTLESATDLTQASNSNSFLCKYPQWYQLARIGYVNTITGDSFTGCGANPRMFGVYKYTYTGAGASTQQSYKVSRKDSGADYDWGQLSGGQGKDTLSLGYDLQETDDEKAIWWEKGPRPNGGGTEVSLIYRKCEWATSTNYVSLNALGQYIGGSNANNDAWAWEWDESRPESRIRVRYSAEHPDASLAGTEEVFKVPVLKR